MEATLICWVCIMCEGNADEPYSNMLYRVVGAGKIYKDVGDAFPRPFRQVTLVLERVLRYLLAVCYKESAVGLFRNAFEPGHTVSRL